MKYECFKGRDVTPNRSTWSCYDELVYHIKYRALQFYKNVESVIDPTASEGGRRADRELEAF